MRENIGLYRGKPKNKGDYYFFSLNWKEHCKDGFVYGSLVIAHGRYYICVSALCRVNCSVNNGVASMIEVIPETVGQYTGLTDKNGKKIFEGDILNCCSFMGINDFEKCLVRWSDLFLCFRADTHSLYGDSERGYEVIGNIHDNSELLKGGVDNDKV